jgi:hypothetical protein
VTRPGWLPGNLGAGPLLVISDVPKDVEPFGYKGPVPRPDRRSQPAGCRLPAHRSPRSLRLGSRGDGPSQRLRRESAQHAPFVIIEVQRVHAISRGLSPSRALCPSLRVTTRPQSPPRPAAAGQVTFALAEGERKRRKDASSGPRRRPGPGLLSGRTRCLRGRRRWSTGSLASRSFGWPWRRGR